MTILEKSITKTAVSLNDLMILASGKSDFDKANKHVHTEMHS